LEEVKSCIQERDETLRSYIQCWSVIKNSTEDVSDERAIDAFSAGLRRSDLMEEIGRIKPRIVLELMEIANRFADGEDTYNNKRGRSPKVDKSNRQRRQYRNGDNHGRQNQIATGYDERNEEGYGNKEFQARDNRGKEKPRYSGPSVEDMLYGPCRIYYACREKSLQPPDEGLQNLPKVTKCHGFKPRNMTGRKNNKSRISNAATCKATGVKDIYISNDSTSAKVKEREEEHIKIGQPGNIITTSYYRVSKVV
jgi:hypothetical protein